jgi:hypothetical protein
MILRASSSVQQACTPGEAIPGTGGIAGAAGYQQTVEAYPAAVIHDDMARLAVDADDATERLVDAQSGKVPSFLTQHHAGQLPVPGQQGGDGHTRIRGHQFAADEEDFILRRIPPNGFGGGHSRRSVADDQMLHCATSLSKAAQWPAD